jgi:hypothetical protein
MKRQSLKGRVEGLLLSLLLIALVVIALLTFGGALVVATFSLPTRQSH